MSEIYRSTAGFVNPVGAGVEVAPATAVIIPPEGFGFKLNSIELATDLAVGASARVFLQESTDSGATFTSIFAAELRAAGTMNLGGNGGRPLAGSPTNLRQAVGSTALRYRLAWQFLGGAGNLGAASLSGRTEQ